MVVALPVALLGLATPGLAAEYQAAGSDAVHRVYYGRVTRARGIYSRAAGAVRVAVTLAPAEPFGQPSATATRLLAHVRVVGRICLRARPRSGQCPPVSWTATGTGVVRLQRFRDGPTEVVVAHLDINGASAIGTEGSMVLHNPGRVPRRVRRLQLQLSVDSPRGAISLTAVAGARASHT